MALNINVKSKRENVSGKFYTRKGYGILIVLGLMQIQNSTSA
jgi:hypothetical protein